MHPVRIALSGTISAGKTTLAKRLSSHYRIEHISADEIRTQLHGERFRQDGVFEELQRRWQVALDEDRGYVLDSTGLVSKYRDLLELYPDTHLHIHLTCDYESLLVRENRRGRLDADQEIRLTVISVWDQSCDLRFGDSVKTIDTSHLTPEEVEQQVIDYLATQAK